jgi:hypothetical protein
MRCLAVLVAVVVLAGCGSSSGRAPAIAGAPKPAGRGVFVDAAGGFSVRFPSKPRQFNEPGSLGSFHFTIHVAVARGARGNTVVEKTISRQRSRGAFSRQISSLE